MTETTTKNFLGIPIHGDIIGGRRVVEQRPLEDIFDLFMSIIDDPFIEEFGWRQYTPYFNDGDPCEFGVGDLWFLSADDVDDEADQKDRDEDPWSWEEAHHLYGDKGFQPTLTEWVYDEEPKNWLRGKRVDSPNPRSNPEAFERCKALVEAIGTGKYENALLEKFGDHAIVLFKGREITVERYEHE